MPLLERGVRLSGLLLLTALSTACFSGSVSTPSTHAQPTAELTQWAADLRGEHLLRRRMAARHIARAGEVAWPLQQEAMHHADPQVRRITISQIGRETTPHRLDALTRAVQDADWSVRLAAAEAMGAQTNRTDAVDALLQTLTEDPHPGVRQTALQASWPWTTAPRQVRDRPDLDYDLRVVWEKSLSATGWKFHLDQDQQGHRHPWFAPDLDDTDWADIAIDKVWGDQGHPGYSGVAWYRLQVDLPERPALDGVDLIFEGVDNSAWVWVNGRFVAAHDIGPAGWDKTFRMEVSELLQWDAPNQITVRVRNGPYAGGIYKPVRLEALHR